MKPELLCGNERTLREKLQKWHANHPNAIVCHSACATHGTSAEVMYIFWYTEPEQTVEIGRATIPH